MLPACETFDIESFYYSEVAFTPLLSLGRAPMCAATSATKLRKVARLGRGASRRKEDVTAQTLQS